ncbi:MAG: FecR family protein [Gallionellaceae bacterium]|nr:FecR family protein [Gallionellaceae bacterium]
MNHAIVSKLWFLLCVFGFFVANSSFAASESIEIVKAEGGVTVSDKPDGKQSAVTTKSTLPAANVISTGPNGRAVVKVGGTGYIVLEKNSQVEMNNSSKGFFRQLTGMVYYAVNSIKGKDRSLEVRTKTATMGIRGTRFIVTDVPERQEVGVRKGTVSVESSDGDFEIHKKAEMDEFEAMKREAEAAVNKEKSDFDAYKETTEKEFVEFKREFSLSADRMVSFNGKRVDDRPLSGETKKDMETLEGFAGEWLKQVRD